MILVGLCWLLAAQPFQDNVYQQKRPSRDGIGKFYLGREISQVMGYQGISWLERGERERADRPDLVVDGMALRGDEVVVDFGAGSGYFTFRLAPLVPRGKVLAVDIQPQMLDVIRSRLDEASNVEPVLGAETRPNLGERRVDAVLMVDVYHELSHPREIMNHLISALRPGGRVYLVEYRGEDRRLPIKPLHKMTQAQAKKEMAAVGLRWVKTENFLPRQHFMVFEKPQPGAAP